MSTDKNELDEFNKSLNGKLKPIYPEGLNRTEELNFESENDWLETPTPEDPTHQCYECHPQKLEIVLMDPQPVPGEFAWYKKGRLFCWADSMESADSIFVTMVQTILMKQAKIKKKEKKIITKSPHINGGGKIINPFKNGSIFLPKNRYN